MNSVFVFRDIDYITVIRVLVGFILGGVVGFQRQRVGRPAGLRTHMLVCAGCTCFTLASVYGFEGLGSSSDPARLAAQIITGVGFLGAGTIFRTGSAVKGLTTASSIWITAAIGIVAGLGMFWLAVTTTALTWFTLTVVKGIEARAEPTTAAASEVPAAAASPDDLD